MQKGPLTGRWDRLVPVANRRVPRASRSAPTSDGAARVGGACLPTGASRGGTQARFFEAPALVAGFDDFAMMGQAVDDRDRHCLVAEHGAMPQ